MGLLRASKRGRREPDVTMPAMFASAEQIRLDNRREVDRLRKLYQAWQPLAWDYHDTVGELMYGAGFVGNAMSRLRLVPAVQWDPEEDPVPIDLAENVSDAEKRAVTMAVRRLGSNGGYREMLKAGGVNFTVAGEGYLVGVAERPERNEPERWEFRAQEEVLNQSGQLVLKDGPEQEDLTILGERDFIARLWSPSPRTRWKATAPTKSILNTCEELLILDRMARSIERSRNNAGLLLLPTELDFTGPPDPASDTPPDVYKLRQDLFQEVMKSMTTPIQDEGSASAVVPHFLYGAGDSLEKVRLIDLGRQLDEWLDTRQERALRRFSLGINLPGEVILGISDVNHWNAWSIEDSTWRAHLEPTAILFLAGLTQAYLRPMLEAMGVADPWRFVVWYDASRLIARPNRFSDMTDLYDRVEASGEALRGAAGVGEEAAPDEAEIERRLAIERAKASRFALPEAEEQGDEDPLPDDGADEGTEPPEENQTAAVTAALQSSWDGEPTGAFVGLMPTPEQAAAIARDGGDAPEDLHVTLCFLGDAADLDADTLASIRGVCEAAAAASAPIEGTVAGVGHFDVPDLVPCFGLIDAVGISGLRSLVANGLQGADVEYATDHDFVPHLTLGYHEPDGHDSAADEVTGQAVTFGTLVLRLGIDAEVFELTGDALTAAARPKRTDHGKRASAIDRDLRARLSAAVEASMGRVLERAGARLVNRVRGTKDQTLKDTVRDLAPEDVAATLGPKLVRTLNLNDDQLLGGAFEDLARTFNRYVSRAQQAALELVPNLGDDERTGLVASMAEFRSEAWDWLRTSLIERARTVLYSPDPEPPERGEAAAFQRVPATIVREAVARAGGNHHRQPVVAAGDAWAGWPGVTAAGFLSRLKNALGIGTGWWMAEVFEDHGIRHAQYVWNYGVMPRVNEFEPHSNLDGVAFTRFDDPALANNDGWPEDAYFIPGDHDGCECDFDVETEELPALAAGSRLPSTVGGLQK